MVNSTTEEVGELLRKCMIPGAEFRTCNELNPSAYVKHRVERVAHYGGSTLVQLILLESGGVVPLLGFSFQEMKISIAWHEQDVEFFPFDGTLRLVAKQKVMEELKQRLCLQSAEYVLILPPKMK